MKGASPTAYLLLPPASKPHRHTALRRGSADGVGSARTRGVGAGRSDGTERLAPGGRAALPLTCMRCITRTSFKCFQRFLRRTTPHPWIRLLPERGEEAPLSLSPRGERPTRSGR